MQGQWYSTSNKGKCRQRYYGDDYKDQPCQPHFSLFLTRVSVLFWWIGWSNDERERDEEKTGGKSPTFFVLSRLNFGTFDSGDVTTRGSVCLLYDVRFVDGFIQSENVRGVCTKILRVFKFVYISIRRVSTTQSYVPRSYRVAKIGWTGDHQIYF